MPEKMMGKDGMKQYGFWFVTGSQHLYGPEVLQQVAANARAIVEALDASGNVPGRVIDKGVVTDAEQIERVMQNANLDQNCCGVITWMHTFSPSKMWIGGLNRLQKPLLHFNTQFNRDIPWDSIDMDFMNLNQSAHGDREYGFIGARMRVPRKIISGHWQDPDVCARIGGWMRSAIGAFESRRLKVGRISDNMRNVAVTEGDKVEAEIKLGWSVNTYGVGDIVQRVDTVPQERIDAKMAEYGEKYDYKEADIPAIQYQAREEVALRDFLEEGDFGAFTDNFEDLQGLRQLPGLAVQNLMADGYGFGGEGDWKVAALVRVMKLMSQDKAEGTAFIEDYTYHMEPGNEGSLGAHMLEVDPAIAVTRPHIEVLPLGIGNREAPARLCFETGSGDAILATLVDMGGRFRMVVNDVQACAPFQSMPKLPVAQVMWKPTPSLSTAAEAWILAGGAHHSALSYALTAEHMRDFSTIMGIEFVHIHAGTKISDLERELTYNDVIWKFKS